MKYTLLLVLLLPFVVADPIEITSYCVLQEQCSILDEQACLDSGGTYSSEGIESLDSGVCEVGCCTINGESQEGYTRGYCTQQAGEFAAECPAPTEPVLCNGVEMQPDQFCCEDGPSDSVCDESGVGSGDVPNQLNCGNEEINYETGELCDYTVDNLASCPDVDNQYCTPSCTCAYTEETQDPNTCSPTNPECQVTSDSCGLQKNDLNLTVDSQTGELIAIVTYGVTADCQQSLEDMSLTWQDTQEQDVVGVGLSLDETTQEITQIQPEKEYLFTLTALFLDDEFQEQTVSITETFSTGDSRCYTQTRSFCDGNTPTHCQDDNTIQTDAACVAGEQVCAPIVIQGQPSVSCQEAVDCSECNTGYDTFAETTEKNVLINGEEVSCSDLDNLPGPNNELIAYCYLEYEDGPAKTYQACTEVSSCYDYNNQDACNSNTCKIQQLDACEWNSAANVCLPANEEPKCDIEGVTPTECSSIADYCEFFNNQCLDEREDYTCQVYNGLPESACTEGQAYTMDVITHEVLNESQNRFNLTKCRYIPTTSGDTCVKDSDADGEIDPGTSDYERSDFIAPNTTILTNINTALSKQPTLRFSVEDNKLPTRTLARLYTTTCDVAPQEQITTSQGVSVDQAQRTMTLTQATQDGNYCLKYFSRDLTSNLEVVQQANITIIAQPPQILYEDISIEYNQEPPYANVQAQLNISEPAICTFTFNGVEQLDQSWSGRGTSFSVPYPGVKEGNYDLQASCTNAGGVTTSEYPVNIDFNATITNPMPARGTNISSAYQTISIDVQDSGAVCQYRQIEQSTIGEWTDFTQVRPITAEYTRHESDTPSDSSGLYYFQTRCTLSSGSNFLGSPADAIRYTIDELPPEISVYRNQEEVDPTTLIVPSQGTEIEVVCEDARINGIPQTQTQTIASEGNFEIGNVKIYDDEYQMNTDGETSVSITVMPQSQIVISCEDGLGNQAEPVVISSNFQDIKGPERPTFEVVP